MAYAPPERPLPSSSWLRGLRGRVALVAAVLWSLLCAAPGLLGSWVYDDLLMVDSPAYDGLDDVPLAFVRTSYDYQYARARVGGPVSSETYRPVTMATLIATHALAPEPLPHHLLGWVLHLLVAGLLFRWLRVELSTTEAAATSSDGVALVVAAWLALLFLLHPVGVEAYVWINGRSDVVAALFVLASALLIARARRHVAGPSSTRAQVGTALLAALLALGALGSKETALIPLAAMGVAALVSARQQHAAVRPTAIACVGAVAGVTVYFAAWHAVRTGPFGSLGAGSPALSDPTLLHFAPKLVAIAAGALASLQAVPMQSYAWLAVRALTPVEWAAGLLLVAAGSFLVVKRDLRGLLLVAGALLSLAPTLLLSHALWLGLDRYLYMPLLLLLAAAAPHVRDLAERSRVHHQRLPAVLAVVLLVVASASTAIASSFYRDHGRWQTAPREADPLDPTRHVLRAKEHLELGDANAARAELASMPPFPWPLPVLLGALDVALAVGDEARYDAILAQAVAVAPDHVGVRFHLFHSALRRGQLAAALARVPDLAGTDLCTDVAEHLRVAAEHYPAEVRPSLLVARERMTCPPRPAGRAPR